MHRRAEYLGPNLNLHPLKSRAMLVYRVTLEAIKGGGDYYKSRDLAALSEPPARE